MAAVDLKALVGKLNGTCRSTLESAAGLTLSRSHYNIEIEHWLIKLLETNNTDLALLLRHYEVDESRLAADLTKVLDKMKTGNSRAPALSPQVVKLAREAWVLASLQFGAPKVRSSHLLCALLLDDSLAPVARESSAQFARIPVDALQRDMMKIVADSDESIGEAVASVSEGGGAPMASPGAAGGTALAQFTIDLTQRARNGEIDPVLGRDAEVRQIVDILTRRRQNNPILTGEAGVGKTAVVEGFALRVAQGDVPPALQNIALRTLDLGLLQAGAGVKGEFENRLKSVIEEVKSSPKPIILFIDEAHTLIGAGGQAGQGDAANLLKPALARGELRTIAATTWAEYKKYFERDAALARRFQVVKVEEPTEAVAIEMMRGLVGTLEKHHGVRILDEAVVDSVRLSHRYIPGRQLPDKSVSLLDTACARVNMSQAAVPPEIEDRRRRLEQLEVESGILEREEVTGGGHATKLGEISELKEKVKAELADLEERWSKERELIDSVRDLRDKLETAHGNAKDHRAAEDGAEKPEPASEADIKAWLTELADLNSQLSELQGEEPLLQVCVDGQAVAAVVATWTGIPVGRMVSNEIRQVLNIKQDLEKRIIGQSHALDAIAQAMRTSRAKLTDPRKPIGVFLFCGTSGVGKTETALSLAELLYGGEQNVTTINMSEFKEEHKVSTLMGSPPGYVGYGEGGVLTEAVRRRPYSVILFDEMEKAHPGVQDVFYQLFDKGMLRDGEGRDIDFKNTVIIMTSNAGTDTIAALCDDPETMPDEAGLAEALRPELLKVFKPAFLGRVTLVPYFPLSDDVLKGIVKLQLNRVATRVRENYKAAFEYDPALIDAIAERCKENESGARNIEHILSRTMLPEMSALFLERMAEGGDITDVRVSVDESGGFEYHIG
jgi:type VI secretion system protein VasG